MENNKEHILIVDDDKRLRELLEKFLVGEGFKISTAANASEARDIVEKQGDDLALLVVDVMMPGESGFDLTAGLKHVIETPVLMLTAMGEVEDRIKGLESGADDYLCKPFDPRELLLRIENLLKRSKKPGSKKVSFDNYQFNLETGDLSKDGNYIKLTSAELKLLTIFASNINKSVSRETLSAELNGISERSVDVQVTRLRKKIEKDPKNPEFLITSRSHGYMLRMR